MRFKSLQHVIIRIIATISLILAAITIQPGVTYAANPLYIRATLTEPTTQVNQLPKVVQTYGNTGSHALIGVETFCEYSRLTSAWPIDLSFNVIDRPQAIIPGQNTNRETAVRTIAPGQVQVVCRVSGRDVVTNEQFAASSEPLTLTVN